MSGTTITYNGVVIEDVLTQEISQTIEYDSAGGVDPIYVKTIVTARVTFHLVSGAGLGLAVGTELAGGVASALRLLAMPRRRFTMTIGGNTLIDMQAGATVPEFGTQPLRGPGTDMNNGPKPTLKLDTIAGTRVATGTFTVEMAVPLITSEGNLIATKDGVSNLRFWMQDEFDVNWFTTRTYHGRIRVANKTIIPMVKRNLVIPPLQDGFRRKSQSFTEDPNGLEMTFAITDEEVYRAAPFPATSWSGNHRISTPYAGGAIAESELTVRLEGAHDTPQTKLIQLAVAIMDQKLNFFQDVANTEKKNSILLFAAIDAPLHENKVTLVTKIKHVGTEGSGLDLIQTVGPEFGRDLSTSVNGDEYAPWLSRRLEGATAGLLGVFLSRVQLPQNHADMPKTTLTQTVRENPGAGTGPPATETFDLPLGETEDEFSDEHKEAMYTKYRASSTISSKTGTITLPRSGDGSTPNKNANISLWPGVSKRDITIEATRIGDPPSIPEPKQEFTDDNGIVHTLENWSITPATKLLGSDGVTQVIEVFALYTYVMSRSPDPLKDFMPSMAIPYVQPGHLETKLPPRMFKAELMK